MKKSRKLAAILTIVLVFLMSMSCVAYAGTGANGLIAQYKFDGDFKDATGNGFDGTNIGDVTFADDGVVGKCASFNHGYLNITKGSSLDLGSQYTITAWIKLDPDAQDEATNTIFHKLLPPSSENTSQPNCSASTGGTNSLELFQTSLNQDNSTNISNVTCENLTLAEGWTHVAFSTDGTTEYIYVNGKLAATMVIPSDLKNGSLSSDGVAMIGNDGATGMFLGKMDDLRIYNYALSGDEIKALANSGATSHKIVLQLLSTSMFTDGQETTMDVPWFRSGLLWKPWVGRSTGMPAVRKQTSH